MRKTKPGNPQLAVGYLRASTEDQKLGPEAQRAAIQAWAVANGVTVASWHEDAGVSGGKELDNRPALIAALAALREHDAGLLLIAKRDRIARDVYIALTIERAVEACGARVVCADGVANGDGDADKLLRGILDLVAQHERAMIRARTKAALAAKKARGERIGELPFGFRLATDGVHLEQDEAEQAVIAHVRQLRAAGLSLRAVVAELEHQNLVSRTGRPFGVAQVHAMAKAAA